MSFKSAFLFATVFIVGATIIVQVFKPDPVVMDPKEQAEQLAFNQEHCKKSGLIYVQRWDQAKGECVDKKGLMEVAKENERKMQEIETEKANKGLK